MLGRSSKWLVVVLLITATGGHWTLLQSAAWVGMAVSYAQTDSISAALRKTFDGQHPCQLCRIVKEGKASEQKREQQKIETKLDFLCAPQVTWLLPPAPFQIDCAAPGEVPLRVEAPPLPPPRLA